MEPVTYKLQHEGNRYWTEPILSDSEWLNVLHLADSSKNEMQLNTLLMFFYQPGHKATCSAVGKAYSTKAGSIRNLVMNFGRFVVKNCGKEFRIETTESEKDTYWCIPMLRKELKDHFEWELRPELVSALRSFLIEKLIAEYRGPVLKEGLDNFRSKESYKWRLLSSAKGKSIPEVLDILSCPEMNILTWRTKDSIKSVHKSSPDQLEHCFSKLLSVDGDFYQKFSAFVSAGREFLSKQDADRILREKEAALFLACVNPEENAVYKWALYKLAASFLGLEIDNQRPYDAYVRILNAIIPIENKDSELIDKMKAETKGYFWSDLLNAQDVLWQTQEFMKTSRPKNWLQLFYDFRLKNPKSGFNGWFENSYAKNVESLIAFIKDDGTKTMPDKNLQKLLLKKSDNGISNIASGQFSETEYEAILQDWDSIYNLLRNSVDEGLVTPQAFEQLGVIMAPHFTPPRTHPQALRRVWCALFPDLLSSITDSGILKTVYQTIRANDGRLPEPSKDWLADNLALMEYFKENVSFVKPRHRAILAMEIFWNLSYFENHSDMDKYTKLLQSNKNLILTGAPGTGKTHLAKMIAKAMGDDNPGFVQFHPSYDYTDFVEGLRPNDEGAFERVNGVFKQFCADALSSSKGENFDEAYNRLLGDLASADSPMAVYTDGSSSPTLFWVMVNSRGSLDLYTKSVSINPDEALASTTDFPLTMKKNGSLTKERIRDCDNQIYWKGYYKGVKKLLADEYGLVEGKSIGPVPRVFIIDEINRGELSKIFGELFFAIEPSYRGPKGCVKTQYQNLVEPGDPFEKGFYVPENVYVIGTMNDIDRGVESMDFAIRRRFAWMEVKVEDRIGMLDEEIPEWSEAAKRCLREVNKALTEKEIGLTRAYHIGPSYFLKLKNYDGRFEDLWNYHIQGILAEYLRGMRDVDEKLKTLKEAFDSYKA